MLRASITSHRTCETMTDLYCSETRLDEPMWLKRHEGIKVWLLAGALAYHPSGLVGVSLEVEGCRSNSVQQDTLASEGKESQEGSLARIVNPITRLLPSLKAGTLWGARHT